MQVRSLCPVLAVVGYGQLLRLHRKYFCKQKKYFRSSTCNGPILKINIEKIRSESCSDLEIIAAYKTLLENSLLRIDKHVAKDVLQSILDLYIRVRSFPFAKGMGQCYKIQTKQLKDKALRKEISRASNSDMRDNPKPMTVSNDGVNAQLKRTITGITFMSYTAY